MIFWIVAGLAVLALAFFTWKGVTSYHGLDSDNFFEILGVLVLASLVTGVLVFVQACIPTQTEVQSYGLSALATGTDEGSGYFFLGTGVVDDQEVYRYIEVSDDGGNRLKSIEVYRAAVYETADAPHLERDHRYADAGWLVPWRVDSARASDYRFYIPEGSIIKGYEVGL